MNKIKISALIALFVFAGSGLAAAQTGGQVILVSDNEADSAVAEAVKSVKGIQVVVTPWGDYSQVVADQIKGLNPEEVLIIGGPAAVPSDYETALLEVTSTVRVAGKDRYATSARVLDLFRDDFKGKGAVLVYGYDKKGIEAALKKAKAKDAIVVFSEAKEVPWEVQKALEKAEISTLDVEESPNMDTTEIKDDVDDDVGEVSFSGVDLSLRASEQIQEAKEKIIEAEKKISELGATATAPLQLLENARKQLEGAEAAFNEGKYGEAFGSAVASEHLAENAKHVAGDMEEYEKEGSKESKGLEKKVAEKIEDLKKDLVELEEKISKAESAGIDATDAKAQLAETTLKLEEAEAALEQGDTSLAVSRLRDAKNLRALSKVSLEGSEEASEKGGEKELDVKVEIENGVANVKVEINDDKTTFVLGTVEKAEIIAEIASRTDLTTEDIEGVIEFEGNHAELGEQKIEKEDHAKKDEVKEDHEKKDTGDVKEEQEEDKGSSEDTGSEEDKSSESSSEDAGTSDKGHGGGEGTEESE